MQPDSKPLVLSNARLVLADRVIDGGWIAAEDGMIVDFGADRAPAGAEDVAGDFIIPGLIELHTDHLEAHYMPRPKVYWDPVAAVVSYDAQLASCGITTVLDSLRVWREEGVDEVGGEAALLAAAIATARDADMLRVGHFLHLRCEVPMPDVVAEATVLIGWPEVRLVSLMDHTPGQRQFRDEDKLRTYYRGKAGGLTDAQHGLDIEVQTVEHPSRVHLDIETDDIDAEVRRLEGLGAKKVEQVKGWWVMQAPTGQRFCVVRAGKPDFERRANVWP